MIGPRTLIRAALTLTLAGCIPQAVTGQAESEALMSCEKGDSLCDCGPACRPEYACFPSGGDGQTSCKNFCKQSSCGGPLDMALPPSGSATCPAASEGFPFPADLPQQAPAAVGSASGAFSLTESGEAAYSIALDVPPGRAGMQPSLAVTFNSGRGLGLLGKGFDLQGLSTIERCGSTLGQDGVVRGVAFDAGDHFCFEGARLVADGTTGVDPGSGDNIVEYRTRPDSFNKVIAHYPAGSSLAPGPASFVVYTAAGHIETFGTRTLVAGSGATSVGGSWLLSQVADRRGNTVNYSYTSTNDAGGNTTEYAPLSISYTGHPTLAADRFIYFDYQPLINSSIPAPMLNQSGFHGGNRFQRTKLLTGIRMVPPGVSNNPVRQYQFTYHASQASSWPLLDSVQECAGAVCKPATTFKWNDSSYKGFAKAGSLPQIPISEACEIYAEASGTSAPSTSFTARTTTQWLLADVNGDGLPDMVSSTGAGCDSSTNAGTNVWRVALNRGGGLFTPWKEWARFAFPYDPADGAAVSSLGQYQITPIDVDQDGNMDLMLYRQNGLFVPTGDYQYLKSVPPTQWDSVGNPIDGSFTLTDTGIPQPAWATPAVVQGNTLPVNTPASVLSPPLGDDGQPFDFHHVVRFGDVNGDGVADLIQCLDASPFQSATYATGAAWSVFLWSPTGAGGHPGYSAANVTHPPWTFTCASARSLMHVVDIDGDGKQEILARWDTATTNTNVWHSGPGALGAWSFSAGSGWTVHNTNLPIPVAQYLKPVWMDVNGDGYVDYVYPWGMEAYIETYIPSMSGALQLMQGYPDAIVPSGQSPWHSANTWDPQVWTNSSPPDVPWVNLNLGNGKFSGGAVPASYLSAGFVNLYNDPTHHPWTIAGFAAAAQLDYNGDGIMDLMLPAPGAVATLNQECLGCIDVACLYCTLGLDIASVMNPTFDYTIDPAAGNTTLTQYWVFYAGVPGGAAGTVALPGLQTVVGTNLIKPTGNMPPGYIPGPFGYNNDFFNPKIGDIDGDGRDDVLMADQNFTFTDRTNYGKLTFWKNDVPKDRLIAVSDGLNVYGPSDPNFVPSVSISYATLVDQTIMAKGDASQSAVISDDDYWLYNSRSNSANHCVYPHKCFTGPRTVVNGYSLADGQGAKRDYSVGYRDARYDESGRGWLGFGEIFTRNRATGAGSSKLFDNYTVGPFNSYPFALKPKETFSWSPNQPGQPKPAQIELSYSYETRAATLNLPGVTYFVSTQYTESISEEATFNNPKWPEGYHLFASQEDPLSMAPPAVPTQVLRDANWNADKIDSTWGNVLQSTSTVKGVDLVNVTTTNFNNDAPSWIIGRPNFTQTCSTALGVTRCPNQTMSYTNLGELQDVKTGDAGGDPELAVTSHFDLDVFGNVVHGNSDDLFGNHRSLCMSFDASGTFPYASGNGLQQVTHFKYEPSFGQLATRVDPSRLATRWGYDGFGRQILEQRADGTSTKTTLNRVQGPSNLLWSTTIATQRDGGDATTTRLDGAGRPVTLSKTGAQVKSLGAGGNSSTAPVFAEDLEYDTLGELTRKSLPYLVGDPAATRQYISYRYDGAGRTVSAQAPWDGVTVDYTGFTVTKTDSGGPAPQAVTQTMMDSLGRITALSEPVAGAATSYGYGPFGQLWSIDHAGDFTTMSRDALGRTRKLTDPNRGDTTIDYDGFGDTSQVVDALGRVYKNVYDSLGRLASRADNEGTTTWIYDVSPLGSGSAGFAVGAISAVVSPSGDIDKYAYDSYGRISGRTETVGPDSFSVGFAYDAFSRLSQLAYPQAPGLAAFAVAYSYDVNGHVVSVKDAASSMPYWTLNNTNDWGRPALETFQGKVTRSTAYDFTTRQVALLQTGLGAALFQNLSYSYDGHFNMLSRLDASPPASPSAPQVEHFAYDALDRLGCSNIDNVPPPPPGKNSSSPCDSWVTYLPNGNIDTKSDIGKYQYDGSEGHANAVAMAGSLKYQYDAVGNQVLRPDSSISYTSFDLPASYTRSADQLIIKLQYDGEHQRIRKNDGATETTYFAGWYERRRDLKSWVDRHVYTVPIGTARLELTRQANVADDLAFIFPDVLGSADVITAANGTVKEHRSYDAWGQQRSSVWKNALSGPFSSIHTAGYTNQEAEASLNLINMKGRIYDPQLARFMQTDPIVGNPFSSQHWNGYSYVLNNPLKFTDPTGYYDDGPPPPDLPPYAPGEAVDNAGNREVIPHMIVVGDRPRSTAPKSSGGEVTPPSDPVAEATPPNEGPGSGGGFGDLHLSESQAPRAPQYGDDDYIPPGEIHTQHQVDFETRMVVGGSYRDGAGGASLGRLLYKLIFGYQPNSVDLNGALHVAKTATIERQIDRSAAMRAAELAPKDGGCFVAGTLVTTAEAERPIEEVALGERVRTAGDEACDGDGDDADLRRVELELPNADFPGDVVQVSLLRSGEWLRENHVEAGKRVFVALAEMGLAGDAHISSVSEVVRVQPGRGCLVTGTYSRTSAGLRDLRFSGGEAVRATAKHPFWSLDRNDWVPAGELRIGERVKTLKVDHE